jgi:hypothetical protein
VEFRAGLFKNTNIQGQGSKIFWDVWRKKPSRLHFKVSATYNCTQKDEVGE